MVGLDELIAGWAERGSVATVLIVATLLGLRHAADPDHLAAVTILVASGERRSATSLGACWGVGHGVALVLFGLPIVLYESYVPDGVGRAAETAIAVVIVVLAARLALRRHRRPAPPATRTRSPLAALGVGFVHGTGGSAGLGVLLLSSIPSHALAVVSLLTLAVCTAIAMMLLTAGLSATVLARGGAGVVTKRAVGAFGVAFGAWYAAAAWSLAPYPL